MPSPLLTALLAVVHIGPSIGLLFNAAPALFGREPRRPVSPLAA